MPFHFPPEEQAIMKDADTNAKRGLNYLIEGLRKAEGHVGLALAGYNGGHGVIDWGTARWSSQTQRYYYWGTGIYFEAISGKQISGRLQEWLDAGGIYLCTQAEASQQALAQS
jgi:soluble lytic murein transglycosylase-like protein